jgi:hypothetical protein
MTIQIPKDLLEELLGVMTLTRLVKTGLFTKLAPATEEIRPELRLYRTVLDKALLDQFDKDENYRLQSKLWADLENQDFCEVCDLALLDAESVLSLFEQVTKIFRKKGEDLYWQKDNRRLAKMSDERKQFYLNYEEE